MSSSYLSRLRDPHPAESLFVTGNVVTSTALKIEDYTKPCVMIVRTPRDACMSRPSIFFSVSYRFLRTHGRSRVVFRGSAPASRRSGPSSRSTSTSASSAASGPARCAGHCPPGRRRDCHFTGIPSPFLLKHPLKREGHQNDSLADGYCPPHLQSNRVNPTFPHCSVSPCLTSGGQWQAHFTAHSVAQWLSGLTLLRDRRWWYTSARGPQPMSTSTARSLSSTSSGARSRRSGESPTRDSHPATSNIEPGVAHCALVRCSVRPGGVTIPNSKALIHPTPRRVLC